MRGREREEVQQIAGHKEREAEERVGAMFRKTFRKDYSKLIIDACNYRTYQSKIQFRKNIKD